MAELVALDARLADLERHLGRQGRVLTMLDDGGATPSPCCDAAEAVFGATEGGCACCPVAPA